MAKVEAGDLDARATPGGPDELGRLAESFNTMVDRLKAAREEIEVYHEQRLARAERLATLGEVAASLAHEIRNPLAGIAGAVGVMADELPATDPRREIMGEILDQIHRLNKTVQDLLIFARPAIPTIAPCDVRQVLDRVLLLPGGRPGGKKGASGAGLPGRLAPCGCRRQTAGAGVPESVAQRRPGDARGRADHHDHAAQRRERRRPGSGRGPARNLRWR